jgi:predicted AAA+ superfamily ATPase
MKFLKDFSVDAGYVVTIGAEADAMMGGRQVVFVPLWRWLLRN